MLSAGYAMSLIKWKIDKSLELASRLFIFVDPKFNEMQRNLMLYSDITKKLYVFAKICGKTNNNMV
jgi:hypothetical protein